MFVFFFVEIKARYIFSYLKPDWLFNLFVIYASVNPQFTTHDSTRINSQTKENTWDFFSHSVIVSKNVNFYLQFLSAP